MSVVIFILAVSAWEDKAKLHTITAARTMEHRIVFIIVLSSLYETSERSCQHADFYFGDEFPFILWRKDAYPSVVFSAREPVQPGRVVVEGTFNSSRLYALSLNSMRAKNTVLE
jgi:hypothetical protein